MNTRDLLDQYGRLPAAAQRLVAELVDMLSQQASLSSKPKDDAQPTEAVLLPPLEDVDVPSTWPQNRFMNPEFFGAWQDREDIVDSTEYVRQLRSEQWGAK